MTTASLQAIEPAAQAISPRPRQVGYLKSFFLCWFFVWPLLARICGYLFDDSIWIFVPGNIIWALSCYVIYDSLLKMAEARWPAAKVVREVIGFVFTALLVIG